MLAAFDTAAVCALDAELVVQAAIRIAHRLLLWRGWRGDTPRTQHDKLCFAETFTAASVVIPVTAPVGMIAYRLAFSAMVTVEVATFADIGHQVTRRIESLIAQFTVSRR